LKHDKLNPGDKFLVCSNPSLYDEKLADLYIDKDPKHFTDNSEDPNAFELISNPIIALNIVSIEDSGKIVYLNSDIKKYTHLNTYQNDGVSYTDNYKYHILGEMAENNGSYDQASVDPDSYRNVLNSGYSVFKSKTSGKLAILAELIMIDSYSVTHSIEAKKDADGKPLLGEYDIVVHSEISPEITIANYNTAPKLQYFYLKNSQGYIQVSPSTPQPNDVHQSGELYNRYMFIDGIPNTSFGATLLTDIYSDTTLSGDLQSTG
jgi:hypothetical protein